MFRQGSSRGHGGASWPKTWPDAALSPLISAGSLRLTVRPSSRWSLHTRDGKARPPWTMPRYSLVPALVKMQTRNSKTMPRNSARILDHLRNLLLVPASQELRRGLLGILQSTQCTHTALLSMTWSVWSTKHLLPTLINVRLQYTSTRISRYFAEAENSYFRLKDLAVMVLSVVVREERGLFCHFPGGDTTPVVHCCLADHFFKYQLLRRACPSISLHLSFPHICFSLYPDFQVCNRVFMICICSL